MLEDPSPIFADRTAAVDSVVRAAWPEDAGAALVAVGGYGRRELFPYSDVDLLIVTERAQSEREDNDLRESIAPFLRGLWDAGLRVSQSVHSLAECLAGNTHNEELEVSLLDRRFLAGDHQLFERLRNPPRERLAPVLARLVRARHRTFGNTIFHLEPNVKDAPGALRDLHVIRWLALLSGNPEELPGSDWIYRIRNALHLAAERDQNVLNFAMQDACAATFGMDSAAELMRDYYRQAGPVFAACLEAVERAESRRDSVLSALRDQGSRFSDNDFRVIHGKLFFRRQSADLGAARRLFVFIARHGVPTARETRARIVAAANASLMDWKELRELLGMPHAGAALRAMHETGYLARLFPALRGIEWLVVRDFYHRYTVDEHSLVAVQTALELKSAKGQFGELARETPDYPLLLIALLLHDSGKSSSSENHASVSAEHARDACRAIGMSHPEIAAVLFLIERHLDMSRVMTTRDPRDPATAATVASLVGTIERLKMLTILTYCDISSVNPKALTPWRATLLWQTYAAAEHRLTLDLQEHTAGYGMPLRYELTHTADEIAEHHRMEAEGRRVRLDSLGGQHRLTVVTADRSFLIADVAGALAGFGMNILRAEAFVNERHFAIDTFLFSDPMRTLDLNPSEVDRFCEVVDDVVARRKDSARLLLGRQRPQQSPRMVPHVSVDETGVRDATLFEIMAEDRPGILYELSRFLSESGCNIETVLLDTQGRKAIDVIYVTRYGKPLHSEDAARIRAGLEQIAG